MKKLLLPLVILISITHAQGKGKFIERTAIDNSIENKIGDGFDNLEDPFSASADEIVSCALDGSSFSKINLCALGDSREISVVDTTDLDVITWEKLDETSCAAADESCSNMSLSCNWDTISNSSSFTISDIGEYRVTLTHQNGTFERFYAKVYFSSINATAIVTKNLSSLNASNAEFQLDATQSARPYEYQLEEDGVQIRSWQASNVFSNLKAGNYTAHIRNSNVCWELINVSIQFTTPTISTTINQTSCNGAEDASIEAIVTGGSAPYIYELYDTASNTIITSTSALNSSNYTFGNLTPGNYHIQVTDSNSIQIQNAIQISEPEYLNTNITVTDMTCYTSNNATATIDAFGGIPPYEYSIDGGVSYQQNNLFESLAKGSYISAIRDSNGCTVNSSFIVNNITPLVADVILNSVSCAGSNDGSITITTEGGIAPLQYSIGGNEFTSESSFSELSPGNYDVIVKDAKGCTVLVPTTVLNNVDCSDFSIPVTNYTIETTGESCASSNNGNILVSSVENLAYTATLVGIVTNQNKQFRTFANFNNLEAGSYQLCITVDGQADYEKCFTVNITEPDPLSVTSKVDTSGKTVSINLKGGTNYYINVNGTKYSTSEDQITVPLSEKENNITVQTDKECQGIYEKMHVANFDRISIFPNPVEKGDVTILLPSNNLDKEVLLTLFSQNGIRVLEKLKKAEGRTVKLNMDDLTTGIYTIIITTKSQNSKSKIIKK